MSLCDAEAAPCWPFHRSRHPLSSAPRPLTSAPVTQNQVCLTWRRWQERILNRWQLSLRISWLPGLVTTSFWGWLTGTSLRKTECVSWLLIPPRAWAAYTWGAGGGEGSCGCHCVGLFSQGRWLLGPVAVLCPPRLSWKWLQTLQVFWTLGFPPSFPLLALQAAQVGFWWPRWMKHKQSCCCLQASAKTYGNSFSFVIAGTFCTCKLKEIFSMVDCSAPFQMLPTWVPVSFKVSVGPAADPHCCMGQQSFGCSEPLSSPACAHPVCAMVGGQSGLGGQQWSSPHYLPSPWGPGGRWAVVVPGASAWTESSSPQGRAQSLCFEGDGMHDLIRSSEGLWDLLCPELQTPSVGHAGYIERTICVQEGRCQTGVISNLWWMPWWNVKAFIQVYPHV